MQRIEEFNVIKHFFYYAIFISAGAFFLANFLFGWDHLRSGGDALIKSTAATVLFTVLYISQADRAYLIKSIPLRVIGGISCALGFIVIAATMRLF
jgi:hypothetical protein